VTFYFPKYLLLTLISNSRIFTLCNSFGLTHSVTQSSFGTPCTYLAANTTSNTPAGFDSGLQSSATFTINITDTSREHYPLYSFFLLKTLYRSLAIWFFCKQASQIMYLFFGSENLLNYRYFEQVMHCGIGMVGSINAPATGNTYAAYLAAAKAIGSNELPVHFISSLH
jgi:hypothetical protein